MKDVTPPRGKGPNGTVIALAAGLLLLVLLIAYFATNRNADQDKLTPGNLSTTASADDPEKLCAAKGTYDLIKRELFRRASELRGSDQAAFDKLAGFAVVRMENPVMESQDSKTGAVNCSGSLSLDLPPGVAVVGGRRNLSADVDYVVQQAADGTGPVVMLRNADPIITPLATLARAGEAPAEAPLDAVEANDAAPDTDELAPLPAEPAAPAAPAKPAGARPSFNCANAHSKGEIAVCGDAGLAALDRNMAAQFSRSLEVATPDQAALLRRTGERFSAYRDRCPNNACIGEAYTGRMREIRDIMEGRWTPR